MTAIDEARTTGISTEWWRTAVIYQIYPRSFADGNGDGVGDLPGIVQRLDSIAELGADAIWLSPFYASPQRDGGYDVSDFTDVDPLFGTLDDARELISQAHQLELKVIVDIVPNHTSDEHRWFQAALAAEPGSPERARYLFRDGRGVNGDEPPNNWQSVFGGPAWTRITEADGTPGQWYLHLFDSSQPDLDWSNEDVRRDFDDILRFWLDMGVDGFRVDVAHGLVKQDGLPDHDVDPEGGSMGGDDDAPTPYFGQEGVHDIWRRWRQVVEEYGRDRILAAEAWIHPLSRMAKWVRPDEMHQAFNFAYLAAEWDADDQRRVITESLREFSAVGAPSTWVLSNHDVVRHASRLALTAENPQGHGIGPDSPGLPIPELGLRRARAASLLMLALPGSAYLYQGEELGLPEHVYIPDDARQDPTWFRTEGERYGRDGCRVPLPWTADEPSFGFSHAGESWLPQPEDWADLARHAQRGQHGSTLEMYRSALSLRKELGLATGELLWADSEPGVLAFECGDALVVTNFSDAPVPLGTEEVLLASAPVADVLPPDATVWLRR
ncbi:glycoside hydrolase family 13 protein [Demequina zhanjiangensis]|uniref:Glycoside hydrolase family 13 protein n=1 Tax=Demequina zhanjiangensis TaxID=3051659 RepID=A0ABT8G2U3_9MICO|nr:glycoside hydrolase family 13 protein [Demequina sp. SYSU T00b26]MDN4473014.1 glycoside hydrolase family 13 protein [Demequina sp. SYSU T00b26]